MELERGSKSAKVKKKGCVLIALALYEAIFCGYRSGMVLFGRVWPICPEPVSFFKNQEKEKGNLFHQVRFR